MNSNQIAVPKHHMQLSAAQVSGVLELLWFCATKLIAYTVLNKILKL